MNVSQGSPEMFLATFAAWFEPARQDDLTPGAESLIGHLLEWQYAWVIEDGPYAGQWACSLIAPRPAPFAWAPESDLRRHLRSIHPVRYPANTTDKDT